MSKNNHRKYGRASRKPSDAKGRKKARAVALTREKRENAKDNAPKGAIVQCRKKRGVWANASQPFVSRAEARRYAPKAVKVYAEIIGAKLSEVQFRTATVTQ